MYRWSWSLGMLVIRMVLFAAWQTIFAIALAWRGAENPWAASIAWWPWAAILTNLMVLWILAWRFYKEGSNLVDLYRFDRQHLKSDLLLMLGMFILLGPVGYLPNIFFGKLLFGRAEIAGEIMGQALPLWAAVSALFLMPITHALTELPTYFGYCMTRIETLSGNAWLAVLLPVFFLAVQHVTLPLVLDVRFVAWRFLMFLPFALLVGLTLRWRLRLMPYFMSIHVLIDAATIYFIVAASK